MKGMFFLIFNLFKLIGIKSINDLIRKFGNPDISMPSNSTREDWIKARRNLCNDMQVEFESTCYEVIERDDCKAKKVLSTHIWFLRPYRNIMIAKEYNTGSPTMTLGILKAKKK